MIRLQLNVTVGPRMEPDDGRKLHNPLQGHVQRGLATPRGRTLLLALQRHLRGGEKPKTFKKIS